MGDTLNVNSPDELILNNDASVPVIENVFVAPESTSLDTAVSKTCVVGIFSATVTVLTHVIVGASFTFTTVKVNDALAVAPLKSVAITVIVLVPTLAFVGRPEKVLVPLLIDNQDGLLGAVYINTSLISTFVNAEKV